jgi:hypothetical protein
MSFPVKRIFFDVILFMYLFIIDTLLIHMIQIACGILHALSSDCSCFLFLINIHNIYIYIIYVIRAVGVRKEKIAGIGRTQGNSTETIAKNKKLYDYSKVPQPQLGKAKKWLNLLPKRTQMHKAFWLWTKLNKPALKNYAPHFELITARVDSEVEEAGAAMAAVRAE